MPEDVRITIGVAVLAASLLAIAIWWLWWRLPKREAARLALKIRDPKARADVEDSYRKTVGQALGGIAVLLGAGSAYLQFSQQQRASHDLLISNQVSKGFEQLGSDKIVVRLGGIYALEGVMNNSDQYYQPVLEALTAFIREGTSATTGPMPARLPTDIQAALTVIGRRSAGTGVVDLTKANIAGAYLDGALLTGASLSRAHLTGAALISAHLAGAGLDDADLTGANLDDADMTGAFMNNAKLTGAVLSGTHLTSAVLGAADLTDAHLAHAHLTGAVLTNANLTNANLTNADLTDAVLTDAVLTHADLTGAHLDGQKQLDEACGSNAMLPTGLTLKPCQSQSRP